MEIVEYNEKVRRLSVRFNTHVVWKYSPVDKEIYDRIVEADSIKRERLFKDILHSPNIVGAFKGVV